ncbi:hypothetical protein EDD11_003796 [Mortierella claussenii]|nr:hypothetical protein EDD11_003796 [Mortierella claussenii]
MASQFFQKDIHKSIEGLLYGLYVYQYLLDTSTLGLLVRCLIQEQILSLKTKAPTLRIALYVVFATALMSLLRHLDTPARYAVIIDFIGNVSIPSRSKILWLDALILVLQITHALIVFLFRKTDEIARRAAATATANSRRAQARNNREQSRARAEAEAPTTSTSASAAAVETGAIPASSSQMALSSSLSPPPPLFEYTPESDVSAQDAEEEYYVDEEETRYSLDRQMTHRRTIHRSNESSNSSSNDSDDEENEEDEDPLGDDYEEILAQETFVIQLEFKDLLKYLFSGQDPVSYSRIRAESASDADTSRLPV